MKLTVINLTTLLMMASLSTGCMGALTKKPIAASPEHFFSHEADAPADQPKATADEMLSELARSDTKNGVLLKVYPLTVPLNVALIEEVAFKENWSESKTQKKIDHLKTKSNKLCFIVASSGSFSYRVDLNHYHPQVITAENVIPAKIKANGSPSAFETSTTYATTTYTTIGNTVYPNTSYNTVTDYSASHYGTFCLEKQLDFSEPVTVRVEPRHSKDLAAYELVWATSEEALKEIKASRREKAREGRKALAGL